MTTLRSALSPVESAVLAPVYRDQDGRVRLVLVVRGPRGVHGNQVALPGGKREAEDASLLATALREAEEEIGLRPDDVEVLAALPVVDTTSTGFYIAPFLGRLRGPPPTWRRQEEEISEVMEIPIEDLAQPENQGVETWQWTGWAEPRQVEFFRVGHGHKLWGATHRIVAPLLARLLAGEWEV